MTRISALRALSRRRAFHSAFLLVFATIIVSSAFGNSANGSTNAADKIAEAIYLPTQIASFQDSCENIRVFGTTLSARCQNKNGGYVSTSVQIRGITNVDGNLQYLKDGRGRSTYQDTCVDINVKGATLNARCQRTDGSYNYTTVFLRNIVNNNGQLEYRFDDNGGGIVTPLPQPLPPDNAANFQDSCRNIRVDVATLSAQCRRENRRWRNSSIQIRGITNVDGNLQYLKDGRGRSTYQDTCTNIRISGATLSARCQRTDGGYQRTSISLVGIVNDDGRLEYRLN